MPPSQAYFTTTLYDALQYNKTYHATRTRETALGVIQLHDDFRSISEYVDFLAQEYPDRLAVGCPSLDDHRVDSLSFADVKNITAQTATWLHGRLPESVQRGETIGLRAPSSLVFVVVWLALIRAGYRVLLLAPQDSTDIVKHLLNVSDAKCLFYTGKSVGIEASATGNLKVNQIHIPWLNIHDLKGEAAHLAHQEAQDRSTTEPELATAYHFHSTGTTGLPKLIPQTHHAAVSALPRLQDSWGADEKIAGTFSTTPLYHGGIPDLFRSWSAGAPLWLFPEHTTPVTGEKVIECVEMIHGATLNDSTYLANLSCVPFVLEMIMKYRPALEPLRSLERVGVGGAAMPTALGDQLVSENVNLVSRFGSSECGFLLSSERAFASDKDWSILRQKKECNLFEWQEDELYELVVPQSWPVVSTAEHAARPFRTKDQFRSSSAGWEYTGRADAQVTLATGKKIDPHGIEDALRQDDNIEEALLVGEGKPNPGLLIFLSPNSSNMSEEDEVALIQKRVEKINVDYPSHARVKRDMVKILPFAQADKLEKNVKGSIVASQAFTTFKPEIDALYAPTIISLDASSDGSTIRESVTEIVRGQAPAHEPEISKDKTLQENGLDSIGYVHVRDQLEQALCSAGVSPELSLGKVYECGTIERLASWTENTLKSNDNDNHSAETTNERIASQLNEMVDQFADSLARNESCTSNQKLSSSGREVILTGVTGFLGGHIFAKLLENNNVEQIHLLIRRPSNIPAAEQQTAVESRANESLQRRGLSCSVETGRVVVYPTDFSDTKLGLTDEQYKQVTRKTSCLIHAAWEVNFNLPLIEFRPQIKALVNLYNLLEDSELSPYRKRFVFCSSTAVASDLEVSEDFSSAKSLPSMGYSQSKIVAEKILHMKGSLEIAILRVGQLCGDTVKGIWNRQEAWPLMINAGCHRIPQVYAMDSSDMPTAVLPDLARSGQADVDWLPVDIAADHVLSHGFKAQDERVRTEVVANTTSHFSWTTLQDMIQRCLEHDPGSKTVFVEPTEWLELLEKARNHQAQALIPLWRKNWRSQREEMDQIKDVLSTGNINADLLNEETIQKTLTWMLGR